VPFAFPRLHLPDFSVSKGQDVTAKLDPGMVPKDPGNVPKDPGFPLQSSYDLEMGLRPSILRFSGPGPGVWVLRE